MKVAHFCNFAPNRSGQCHTAFDLIKAEKMAGIDAGFIGVDGTLDAVPVTVENMPQYELQTLDWAKDADVLVRHYNIPATLRKSGKPMVMCMHGRPPCSFILGVRHINPVYQTISEARNDYDLFVTFWEDYKFNWSFLVDAKKLCYVPPPVDLDKFSLEGKKRDFGDDNGSPNIVIADMWRDDINPYWAIHGALYYKMNINPKASVHVYGVLKDATVHALIETFQERKLVGQMRSTVQNMDETFRAADIVVTPHRIATRIVRESLACGASLVAGPGCPYTPYTCSNEVAASIAEQIDMAWQERGANPPMVQAINRGMAEREFNPKRIGEMMKAVFERAITEHEAGDNEDNKQG